MSLPKILHCPKFPLLQYSFSLTDGIVAFFNPSVTIDEGEMADVCVLLSTGEDSQNMLEDPLTVLLTVTNGKAGIYIACVILQLTPNIEELCRS